LPAVPIPPLTYHPLEKLPVGRPVDRYRHVGEACRGKRVLDLGAYDETEVSRPQHTSWKWLHAVIAGSAKEVLGVDASPQVPPEGLTTTVGTRIVRGRVEELGGLVADFRPDLIVAGELIEHTPDTLGWLGRLAAAAPGTRYLATTPNTTSVINLLLALLRRENNHPDHLQVYSYKTLATLASRIPLRDAALTPYYYDPHIFRGRLPKLLSPIVSLTDVLMLRPTQFLFPLTAFGWILEGNLGGSGP
jgi:hypothetical protein